MTIDFSARIESGVKAVFPNAIVQKCVFHAIQLLTRGLIKELAMIKKEYLLDHIEEWNQLSRYTIALEKKEKNKNKLQLSFNDTKYAWHLYLKLRDVLYRNNPQKIERELWSFFSTSRFVKWKGKHVFLQKFVVIFTKRKLKFSNKGMKYVIPKIYKAWRAAIRSLRKELEVSKAHFNKVKYLILMNPLNMQPYHKKKLRKYLKEFPWLRPYRTIIVKFYYQFREPSNRRSSLKFLSRLITEESHPWLKSAVQTLIENEEQVFRFQHIHEFYPRTKPCKSIKVVNESSNKLISQLYQTQCGMRTIKNLRMRISNRLKCPIIVSPTLLAKVN